jgi:enterochelin esterase-like enzyme
MPNTAPRYVRTLAGLLLSLMTLSSGCSDGDGNGGAAPSGPPPPLEASRQFRALAGVSMGGYGAMNLGTKRDDLFGTIASLGGPVDMQQLLRDSIDDNLEVKAQTEIPRAVGEDFTYDHLPPYPDRDTRIDMFQDLTLAFGNPFLHHPDPERQYLASDSEPARLRMDDQFGAFTPPDDPRGYMDGGDADQNGLRQSGEQPTKLTEVGLLARGSLEMIVSGATAVEVGGRLLADLNGDGVFDVGEGLVLNLSEPFVDGDGDGVHDAGEEFSDVGLDGVAASGDFGEDSGVFDYDPDRAIWLDEDPLTRIGETPSDELATQRIYMDVGTQDEFAFARHYEHVVAALREKGLAVTEQDGFAGNCVDLPGPDAQFLLVRYPAGHVGVESVDPDDLLNGDVCGEATVWQRIINMIGFLNESFADGVFGPGDDFDLIDIDFDDLEFELGDLDDLDIRGDMVERDIASPALAVDGGSVPQRRVLVYRPPAFFRSEDSFPVVYFLGGYGQEPDDFERIGLLLDGLILTGQLQNMAFAFLPGAGGRQGSFYVNHVVPEEQAPEIATVTSGRYEDSIIEDLIPVIENEILQRRVRQ